MSRGAPLACLQFQALHNFCESARRVAHGAAAINCRMKAASAAVTTRPRYLSTAFTARTVARGPMERKARRRDFSVSPPD